MVGKLRAIRWTCTIGAVLLSACVSVPNPPQVAPAQLHGHAEIQVQHGLRVSLSPPALGDETNEAMKTARLIEQANMQDGRARTYRQELRDLVARLNTSLSISAIAQIAPPPMTEEQRRMAGEVAELRRLADEAEAMAQRLRTEAQAREIKTINIAADSKGWLSGFVGNTVPMDTKIVPADAPAPPIRVQGALLQEQKTRPRTRPGPRAAAPQAPVGSKAEGQKKFENDVKTVDSLSTGSVSAVAPEAATYGEPFDVWLHVSPRSYEQLANAIRSQVSREVNVVGKDFVKLTPRMTATVSGYGFKVVAPQESQTQALSASQDTVFRWQVVPTSTGSRRLSFTLAGALSVEGKDVSRDVYAYQQDVEVQVSVVGFSKENWQWFASSLAIPALGGLIALWRRKEGSPDRPKQRKSAKR